MNTGPSPAAERASAAWLLTALVLAEVVSAVESTMIFGALRSLYRDLGDPVTVGWTITAFLLVAAASAAICSRLGDIYGRRRMLLIALAAAGVGSLVSALSSGAGGIVAGRAIQGIAGAVLPLCCGLVRENLPQSRVPFGIGVVSSAAIVAAGVAIFGGGLIVDHLHWRWIFHIGVATAVVAWIAVAFAVPRSPRASAAREPVDSLGAALLVPALAALLLVPSQAKDWGWADTRTGALATAGLLLLALWVRHELRARAPLIDVRLLGARQTALANLGVLLLALGPLQSGMVLSILLQQPAQTGVGLGLSATAAGLVLAPSLILAVVVGPGCGILAARHGARVPALIACAVILAAWGGLVVGHAALPWVVAMALLQGVGVATAYAAAPMLIVEAAPPARTSEATGVSSVVRHLFNAIGSQVVAVLLATATVPDPLGGPARYPAPSAFELVFALISALSVLALIASLALPRRGAAEHKAQAARPTEKLDYRVNVV
jgi:MFS family permease